MVLLLQPYKVAIIADLAMVDNNQPPTELLDIVQIVAGENNGGVKLAIVVEKKLANSLAGDNIQTNSGFVEKYHLWLGEK